MKRVIDLLAQTLAVIAGLSLVLMLVHVALDVGGKYLFNAPLPGTAEVVASYYMIAVVFLPLAYIEVHNRPILVELFYDRFGPHLQAGCDVIATLCSIAFYFFLAKESWVIALKSMEIREIVEGTWKVVVWPSRFIIPVGLAIACLALLLRLYMLLTGKRAQLVSKSSASFN